MTSKAQAVFAAKYTITQQAVSLSTQVPVRVQWIGSTAPAEAHDHTYHEVCLVSRGVLLHQTTQGKARVHAGQCIVVPPTAVHSLRPQGHVEVINVYYLAEWLALDLATLWAEPNLIPIFLSRTIIGPRVNPEIVVIDLTKSELASISRELHDIDTEATQSPASAAIIRGAFLKTLARLSRAATRALPQQHYFRPEIEKAILHIDRIVQSASPLDLTALAKECNLFSQAMGRTLNDYFQLRRVHRACLLLMDLRYKITDVALELGYSDTPHFCRMFKRYRGMSPVAYRSMYLGRLHSHS